LCDVRNHTIVAVEINIISDLWGSRKSNWLAHFRELLSPRYKINYIDAGTLADIDMEPYTQERLHEQFVEFGIIRAAEKLLENNNNPKIYIGTSVGGIIAWKAGLKGLKIDKLITISATRLRYETKKPDCPIYNYFGQADPHKPEMKWMNTIGQETSKIIQGGHDIYKNKEALLDIFTHADL